VQDDPSRGFTFKADGVLDMRMDPTKGAPAWELMLQWRPEDLARILDEYSDEPHAKLLAEAILRGRKKSVSGSLESFPRLQRHVLVA
jgi:16S rRNA (cytosine1402-N4)-methyltransferase